MRYTVEVAYVSEEDRKRHVMSYTTQHPEEAAKFAAYYRRKVGNGAILSVKEEKINTTENLVVSIPWPTLAI